jgi:hypothetical protein
VPQDGISTTGLSNTMRMGSVTEVARDESVAMRIRFDGARPFPSQMYFRGPVLTRFDGLEWRPLGLPFAPASVPDRLAGAAADRRAGALRGHARAAAGRLGAAARGDHEIRPVEGFRFSRREDLQWLAERPIYERIRVKAEAYPRYSLGTSRALRRDPGEPGAAARLQPAHPRLARALRAEPANRNLDAAGLSALVLRHIRDGGYDYTLSPGEYGRNAIDEFWLDRKTGFCEHFASAYVVVMRAPAFRRASSPATRARTPSRSTATSSSGRARRMPGPSTGRPGRAGSAPTPPAPSRPTDRQQHPPQSTAGLVAGAFAAMNPELFASLRSAWEAVNNRWNQWILNYTRGQQLDVLKNIGFTPDWEPGAAADRHAEPLASPAPPGPGSTGNRVDPWVRQLERLKRALRSLDIAAAPHEAPRTLAARVRDRLGARGEPLAAALDALEMQRYGRAPASRPDAALTRRFAAESRRLRSLLAR